MSPPFFARSGSAFWTQKTGPRRFVPTSWRRSRSRRRVVSLKRGPGRVQHEDAEAAELLRDLVHERADGLLVAHVGEEDLGPAAHLADAVPQRLRGGGRRSLRVPAVDRDVRARLRQAEGDGVSDAPAAPRDQGDASFEVAHRGILRFRGDGPRLNVGPMARRRRRSLLARTGDLALYGALRAVMTFFGAMPNAWIDPLAVALGLLVFAVDRRGRRVGRQNLDVVFGDRRTPAEKRAILRRSTRESVRTMIVLLHAAPLTPPRFRAGWTSSRRWRRRFSTGPAA
jgi:hypothetical protein